MRLAILFALISAVAWGQVTLSGTTSNVTLFYCNDRAAIGGRIYDGYEIAAMYGVSCTLERVPVELATLTDELPNAFSPAAYNECQRREESVNFVVRCRLIHQGITSQEFKEIDMALIHQAHYKCFMEASQ